MGEDEEPARDADILDRIDQLREEIRDEPDLVSTAPREAYDLWLQQLDSPSESTLESYEYRIKPFLEYLDEEGIDDLTDLRPREIKEFEALRRAGDREPSTLNNQFGTLRQFLAYCHELDAVMEAVVEAINVPELTRDDRVNTEKLATERAQEILGNLERFRYASREHVLMLLLWRTTARIGAIHALDLDDVYLDQEDLDRIRAELAEEGYIEAVIEAVLEEAKLPFIFPRHRPESGTPLKNTGFGERVINISEETAETIEAYIRVNRPDVTDDEGRQPLLASKKGGGRLSKSGIRNAIYILTQPCEFGDPCPYDEDPETCVAREHGHGSKCPGARSPHKIRTGSITWHRDRGWPVSELADKANTSEDLIQGVYDQPEQLIRGAGRRHHLDKLDEDRP